MDNNTNKNRLIPQLKSRHLSMIAIGGSIGTGLFMLSGNAIHTAAPGGALLAYMAIGVLVYFLMTSLGEMATYFPDSGSMSTYANRFVDSSLGFALGWNYWFNWVITVAVDITIAALIIRYWAPMQFLPPYAWSLIFFVLLMLINFLSVKSFGETEYWLALIKVVTVIFFLIIGVLTIFGILGGEYIGTKNLTIGEAPFLGDSPVNKFLLTFGVFIIASFSFQGTELIGITTGETQDPKKNIPKAIKQVFWRILLFYIFTIFVIGLIIPYTSPNLLGGSETEIAKSPFTIVLERSGIAFAAALINTVILTSVLSAANSGVYASSRMLYSMGAQNFAPSVFGSTNKNGVPVLAVFLTGLVIFLIFLMQLGLPNAEPYIIAASGLSGIISWLGIAISHYRFRKAYAIQGQNLDDLNYKAKGFPIGPLLAFILCTVIIVFQDIDVILGKKPFEWQGFLITYMSVIIFLGFFLYHKIRYKTKIIPLEEVNLDHK
ncbi:amino acid permease [Neisseriaceae bacterium PsAf]|nr:amino acid permease [Neisseriaceae bacterium PsAf]MCV2502991.1 amino acid permease [Neisseriaceae bacterium]